MRKSTRITTKKQSRRRRYKTKCRRNTRRCVQRKTRKQYGASGRRTIGEAVDEMRERLKRNDRDWYNANVVPAEERSAKRRAEMEARDRPEAFTAPSIASMGDPEMMRKHLETLDRAEERDNQLLKHALERSIAKADAEAEAEAEAEAARQREEAEAARQREEAEAARQRKEEEKYSFNNLYPITRGPTPLFHYADHIMAAEPVPAGPKFMNIFKNEKRRLLKNKRTR
jgi:hypothetical protein